PVRGVALAIASSWYAQSVWTLWHAPLALAGAYYIVPKVSGRALPSYDFAGLGFWALIFVGGWSGGRHLIGGPVPAWIATMAVAATALLLGHYLVVMLNLRSALGTAGTAVKFIRFGLGAYILGGFLDAITAFRSVAIFTQFTLVTNAQQELALYGAVSMMLFGSIYFAVPRLTGRPWASSALVSGHRLLVSLGVVGLVLALTYGGWRQSADLLNADKNFPDILAGLKPALLAITAAHAVLLAANLLFFVNFFRSACPCRSSAPVENPFRQPATMEATAL
ncbi:MAG TPA: cbb3-type cytochrome c oxidase subunit I, partial [Opitutaceae bacterium]|nr:cbb3-type cytochrome c oxidase subunit I [Opitutaceae bacterium]